MSGDAVRIGIPALFRPRALEATLIELKDIPLNAEFLPRVTELVKGHISLRATIWCFCGDWEDGGGPSVRDAAKLARRHGWVLTRDRGWVCPRCWREGLA